MCLSADFTLYIDRGTIKKCLSVVRHLINTEFITIIIVIIILQYWTLAMKEILKIYGSILV